MGDSQFQTHIYEAGVPEFVLFAPEMRIQWVQIVNPEAAFVLFHMLANGALTGRAPAEFNLTTREAGV
jgi:hypothetical protein